MSIRKNGRILAGSAGINYGNYYTKEESDERFNSRVTNCLIEVPQDVKLELNNGTLTLKAGSKVYIPNGFEQDGITKKFDEVIIENDVSGTRITSNTKEVLFYNQDNGLNFWPIETYSGSTAPSITSQYAVWYDTSDNLIKITIDTGNTWNTYNFSLPLCIYTQGSGQTISIDKVFNGFGFIGSSVFALPCVEALFPNGKNEDGTYNNIVATTERVIVNTSLTADTNTACLLKLTNVSNEWVVSDIIQQTSSYSYDSFNNIWTNSGNEVKCCFVVSIETDSNSKVSSFNSKTALSIYDNNNIQIVSDLPDNPIEGVLYLIPEI